MKLTDADSFYAKVDTVRHMWYVLQNTAVLCYVGLLVKQAYRYMLPWHGTATMKLVEVCVTVKSVSDSSCRIDISQCGECKQCSCDE